ncbi:methylated-DNA-[protein]-cysteine S-methyltransferase [Mycolicibacterium neoaurum]|uniref:methylated-DNA--[protein]-cysteine S-methyltransferase n=1 Tax=Mycolicibacterium neoaurum TaxID=1795 RepID=UPI000564C590|nr:methylated-DNA--[protein]-cysteine S-methyltransferase [Mycolicibacterium neoaurum]SDC46133.1 methylated-DNA-[protein]-cysteine S-methyltransferase [Mycolicibacterium neoaurum]
MTEIFDRLTVDDSALNRLRDRLARAAERAGTLDVAYRTVDTAVGPLLLAATPAGLVRVAFLAHDAEEAELGRLAAKVSPRVLRAPARLDDAAAQIEQYLAGDRTAFDLPLDLRLTAGFRRQVVEHLRDIGYGRRESYADVAAAVGNPKAVRAVGSACGHNPLPLVIPCHRVVRTDGSIGQYAGGAEIKATLLALEAASG